MHAHLSVYSEVISEIVIISDDDTRLVEKDRSCVYLSTDQYFSKWKYRLIYSLTRQIEILNKNLSIYT